MQARKFSRTTIAMAWVMACATAWAQGDYPVKPVKLVLGFPPGGGGDNVARIYGEALARALGQPVVIENRPGAGSTIAAASVARAAPDGYTLYMGNASLMGGDEVLYKNLSYGPGDFVPINRLTISPLLLTASKQSGLTSVQALMERAAAAPGQLNYASSGNGVITHLAGVEFARQTGLELTHVPYKGGAPAAQAIGAGEADLIFATASSIQPMIDAGRAVGLAVTSAQPFALLPGYPTVQDQGVKAYDVTLWWGLFAPSAVPQAVQDTLFAASYKVTNDPQVRAKLAAKGEAAAAFDSQAQFKAYAASQGLLAAQMALQSGAGLD